MKQWEYVLIIVENNFVYRSLNVFEVIIFYPKKSV